jgi:hypothetical protein
MGVHAYTRNWHSIDSEVQCRILAVHTSLVLCVTVLFQFTPAWCYAEHMLGAV